MLAVRVTGNSESVSQTVQGTVLGFCDMPAATSERRDSGKQGGQTKTEGKEPSSHYPHEHLLLQGRIKALQTTSHTSTQSGHSIQLRAFTKASFDYCLKKARYIYLDWGHSFICHSRATEILIQISTHCVPIIYKDTKDEKGCRGKNLEGPAFKEPKSCTEDAKTSPHPMPNIDHS